MMKKYYAKRAAEYEDVYLKPERQEDLQQLKAILSDAFSGMDVLEVACGTGYWTQFIAKTASSILATDANPVVIDLARQKDYDPCDVTFIIADAYDLVSVDSFSNGAFCGFWWSHIPVQKLGVFLAAFHSKLRPASKVVMIDNLFVEGSSTPISRTDGAGNTYQVRRLKDGSEHEVQKNFPTEEMIQDSLVGWGCDVRFRSLRYYWIVQYESLGEQAHAVHG